MSEPDLVVFGKSSAVERLRRPIDNGHELNVVGDPQSNVARFVDHPSGKLKAGYWDSEAGSWSGPPMPHDEIFTVLEGSVTVSNDNGDTYDLKAGDTMYMPKGVKSHWKVDNYVKKVFVIVPGIDS